MKFYRVLFLGFLSIFLLTQIILRAYSGYVDSSNLKPLDAELEINYREQTLTRDFAEYESLIRSLSTQLVQINQNEDSSYEDESETEKTEKKIKNETEENIQYEFFNSRIAKIQERLF